MTHVDYSPKDENLNRPNYGNTPLNCNIEESDLLKIK